MPSTIVHVFTVLTRSVAIMLAFNEWNRTSIKKIKKIRERKVCRHTMKNTHQENSAVFLLPFSIVECSPQIVIESWHDGKIQELPGYYHTEWYRRIEGFGQSTNPSPTFHKISIWPPCDTTTMWYCHHVIPPPCDTTSMWY